MEVGIYLSLIFVLFHYIGNDYEGSFEWYVGTHNSLLTRNLRLGIYLLLNE